MKSPFRRLKNKPASSGEKAGPSDADTTYPDDLHAYQVPEGQEVVDQAVEEDTSTNPDFPDDPRVLVAEAVGSSLITSTFVIKVLSIACVVLAVVSLAMGVAAYKGFTKETVFRYFTVSTDGSFFELVPTSDPVGGIPTIRNFFSKNLSRLFSFHYRNFASHYQDIAPGIMTEQAMIDFSKEIDRIGLLDSMKERREVAEAAILEAPVLLGAGPDDKTGKFTWEMSVPFYLRLESGGTDRVKAGEVRRMQGVARVQIVRVEPTVNPRQYLINRIVIRDTNE